METGTRVDQSVPKRSLKDLSLLEVSEVVRNIGFGAGAVFAAVGAVSAYLLDNFVKTYDGTGEDRLFLTLAIFLLSVAAMGIVIGYLYMIGRMMADATSAGSDGNARWKRYALEALRGAVGVGLSLLLAAAFLGMIAAFAALAETVFDIWRQVER